MDRTPTTLLLGAVLLAVCAACATQIPAPPPSPASPPPQPIEVPFSPETWEVGARGTIEAEKIALDVGCTLPESWAATQLPNLPAAQWRVEIAGSESCPGNTVVWVVARESADPSDFRVLTGGILNDEEPLVFDSTALEDGEEVGLVVKVSGGGLRCGGVTLERVRLVPLDLTHAPR